MQAQPGHSQELPCLKTNYTGWCSPDSRSKAIETRLTKKEFNGLVSLPVYPGCGVSLQSISDISVSATT